MRPLWSHQQAALDACLTTAGHRPGLLALPTGSGKSEIIRRLVLEWLSTRETRAVIAVPSLTLAFQLRASFYLHNNTALIPALCLNGFPIAPAARLHITTYSSIRYVMEAYRDKRIKRHRILLIADECHHCNNRASVNYRSISWFPTRFGFSASPWSPMCLSLFGCNLIYFLSLSNAIKSGILCDYSIILDSDLKPNPGKPFQMFFVRDGSRFSSSVARNGVYFADDISANRPEGNQSLIDRFRQGEIACLYVNRMLLEGFDCPQVKTIFIEKQTRSHILAYQMLGRGLRRHNQQRLSVFVDSQAMLDTLAQAMEKANDPYAE